MAKNKETRLMNDWYLQYQLINQQLSKISAQYNLSNDQFLILAQIVDLGRDTPGQIAEALKTSAPASSRKLNALQIKGYIAKERAPDEDQRKVKIAITPEGLAAYQGLKQRVAKQIGITKEDVAYLARINKQIKHYQ